MAFGSLHSRRKKVWLRRTSAIYIVHRDVRGVTEETEHIALQHQEKHFIKMNGESDLGTVDDEMQNKKKRVARHSAENLAGRPSRWLLSHPLLASLAYADKA